MKHFCTLMAAFFKGLHQNLSLWAENKSKVVDEATFKKWSSDECVDWIISLGDGFEKYRVGLSNLFKISKIDGSRLHDLNALTLKMCCQVEDDDAKMIAEAVAVKQAKVENSYEFVQSKYDEDVQFMEE